ncbi:WD40 repeat-containing protein, putative, partial [Bodo saltans]
TPQNSRQSISGASAAASMIVRVQSAPTASAKLTQMQLGLHHNTRGPVDASAAATGITVPRSGHVGVPEKVFLDRIAPIMCPTYPKGTASWYNSIDTNSAGSVTWVKFARYLQTYYEAVRAKAQRDATLSQHVRYDDIPIGRLQRGPPYRAIQVRESRTQFFLLCTDGCARAVSKDTMKAVDIVHYADPGDPHPIDIKVQLERNQLYVCLPNGFVFVYDITGHLTRQGNITRVFRIGEDHPYNDKGWDKNGGIAVMPKLAKFDPLHMQLPDNGSKYREIPTAIVTGCDVFPLSLHAHCRCGAVRVSLCVCGGLGVVARGQLTCVDPYQETPGSKDQLFFAGFEHGHIALYRPPAVCPVVSAPRKASFMAQPHNDRMTCLRYCNTFPDLRGLLTSSEGGHLALLDVDTAEVVVTFRDQLSDTMTLSDGGGWVNGCRPVHAFDVSQQMPIIGSCGHMRGVTLWSATMRRKIGSFHDHRGPVHSLCFNQSAYHLITIGGDRTMRIWDIRTMKAVQVVVDRERVDSQFFFWSHAWSDSMVRHNEAKNWVVSRPPRSCAQSLFQSVGVSPYHHRRGSYDEDMGHSHNESCASCRRS